MTTRPTSFLIALAGSALALLSLIAGINYKVDPGHLFKVGIERSIAQILLSGRNVQNYTNCDDRFLQKYYIEGASHPDDVVVLGTSRLLRINRHDFPGRSFFNYSVVGATLQDYLGIYEMLRERHFIPKTLILGLDPYNLNRFNQLFGWHSIRPEFMTAAKRLGIDPNFQLDSASQGGDADKYAQLISLAYLKESIAALQDGPTRADFSATDEEAGDTTIKLSDGSRNYKAKVRAMTPEEILPSVITDATARPVYGTGRYQQLDPVAQKALETFVRSLQDDHVQVIFIIVPFHPVAYKLLHENEEYRIIDQAEAYYRSLGQRYGITVLGGNDPAQSQCSDAEFYDYVHPKDSCIQKILRQLPTPDEIAS